MGSEEFPCAKEASIAKAYINEVSKNTNKWAVRLHGVIAISGDHDILLYYRRSKVADIAYSTTHFHREIVAQKIGLV